MPRTTAPIPDRLQAIHSPEGNAAYREAPGITLWATHRHTTAGWRLDPDMTVYQNAVPSDEWHGLTLKVPLDAGSAYGLQVDWSRVDPTAYDPLLQRVMAGFGSRWDGHNWVGDLTTDAQTALEELQALANDAPALPDGAGYWTAAEYLGPCDRELSQELLALDDRSDAGLDAWAAKLDAQAFEQGFVVDDILGFLRDLRDELDQEND